MMNKILEIKNVTKIYSIYSSNIDRLKEIFFKKKYHKEMLVNDDISFDLFEGETLGIIGINGAGKSTILKIISGVINPTKGEIIKRGRVTALLELGTGFNYEMSGYDNIYLNGTLIGMAKKEIEKKIDDIIAFSELGEYIKEPIKTYSSGMKMRLAFSIAIFSEPQIFIVDEALSVGDAHFSAKCSNALKRRKEKNMSIIYVSHDLNSLKLLCDRVLLLDKGKIVQIGDPENVINHYNFLISKLNTENEKIVLKNGIKDSFGTFDVEIKNVEIRGKKSKSNIISSGEEIDIIISIESKKDLKNMTVGMMIKDKYGQDIFGTNTYYHDMDIDFEANKSYICTFSMLLSIGTGKYSVTVAVHTDENHLGHCSHWFDFAEDFEIVGIKGKHFVGLCRLEPKINIVENIYG